MEALEPRCLLSAAPATVVGRFLFYDGSKYDGKVAGINAEDSAALASDKTALIGGGPQATFSNASTYTAGIDGIFVDVSGSHGNISLDDFSFRTGNNNAPASWAPGPGPSALTVRPGAGVDGSDRVEIVWPSGAIWRTWLEVTMAANVETGLATSDVFYFGSAPGDTGAGDSTNLAIVDTIDELGARNHPASIFLNIPLTNLYDFNRDAVVDTTDQLYARNHATTLGTALRYLILPAATAPTLSAGLANDTAPDGQTNADGLTSDDTIVGSLTGPNPITSFRAELDSGFVAADVLPQVGQDGSFTLSASFFDSLGGGPLGDGPHTVHLQAIDSLGRSAAVHVAFTLKRSIAVPDLPDLLTADDTGSSSSDDITRITTPRIDVTAEANSSVSLQVDGATVAQGVANPTIEFTIGPLSDGMHQIVAVSQDAAGNVATSPTLTITVITAGPALAVSTLVPFTDDLTPHVTIAGGSASGPVSLDVDINNDGDFNDAGELGRTNSLLLAGTTRFQLTPALPQTDPNIGPYTVQLRARYTDIAGNVSLSPLYPLEIDTIGSTALSDYVHAVDPSYHYSVANTVVNAGYTYYALDLTSQTWRSTADVDKPLWRHWVDVIVPSGPLSTSALLLITGGNNTFGAAPSSADPALVNIALTTHAVVVVVHTVPSEPLVFTGETQGRSEDAIIAYSFNKYVDNLGQPGDETWPVLVAMVKSAVATMDAAQNFVPTVTGGAHIDNFVVTGYSKRGWTTWLTAAVDARVSAIIPGVIDVLNMDEQMIHHYGFYGAFSPTLNDYVAFDIPQDVLTEGGRALGRIVDPYRYLNNGRFTIPKLVINSSGDEFFVPDSSQFYFSDLPGTSNYLRYVPNTGHGLDSSTSTSTLTFFDAVINNRSLPQYSWTVQAGGSIRLQTTTAPTSVVMWQATNPNARDFRKAYNPTITWTSSTLADLGSGLYVGDVSTPASGARAFFIQMTYPSGIAGTPYVFTTEISVKTNIPLVAWPFYVPPPAGALALAADESGGDQANGAALAPIAPALAISTSSPAQAIHVEAWRAPSIVAEYQAASQPDLHQDPATNQWPWLIERLGPAVDDVAKIEAADLALADFESLWS